MEDITLQKDQFEAEVKRISNILNVKSSSITQVTKIATGGHISGKLTTHTTIPIDTTKRCTGLIKDPLVQSTTFEYKDLPWINIKGEIGKKDSIYLDIKDTLTVTDYSDRK